MSTEQKPVQIDSWEGLCRYIEFLRHGSEKQMKICVIDEENEEILLQTREEFDVNVQYAQEHGIDSLTFVIYLDDQRLFNGIYKIPQTIVKQQFPSDKFQILLDNVLTEKWYIPIKQDEAFGVCLLAAIELAQENRLETNDDCQRFVETVVPEAFRKLQNTQSVTTWPREIQSGIFELLELLVDLVGTRLRHAPVPITLLNTLAMTFDTSTIFAQKHKNELIPSKRVYTLKDEDFLSNDFDTETHGWLRSIIQRFIAQNGLSYIRLQFQNLNSTNAAKEYDALLKLFAKCSRCVNAHRFRMLFGRPIRQAIEYLDNERTSNGITDELSELKDTLLRVCYDYGLKDELSHPAMLIEISNSYEILCPSTEICSETTPLIETSKSNQRKSKKKDCYERLAEDIQTMTMNCNDSERQCVKKQRTEQPLPTTNSLLECIDEILTTTNKRSMRHKHRREQRQQRISSHTTTKETKTTTYDRTNPDDILRYFKPMKQKITNLYIDLQTATANGKIREVLKIQEKLKLLNPFSARFIADENIPDGTIMRPGQVFRKNWVVFNDGSMPWDSEDIQLINLSDGIEIVRQPVVPITAPHTRTTLSVDYKCSNEQGVYESKWILAYRHQTFGPMIWCSINVSDQGQTAISDFELVDIPLPDCFDLAKPFRSSIRSNPSLSRSESFFDDVLSSKNSFSSQTSTENPSLLIDLPIPTNEEQQQTSIRSNQSLDFVDTVVTNIFSVAKQAGSTAKAIFNTLQAHEEIPTVKSTTPTLFNSAAPKDPMKTLIEMGFGDRVKNQRLLKENGNDLCKVIQLLTFDINEDVDCFVHRH